MVKVTTKSYEVLKAFLEGRIEGTLKTEVVIEVKNKDIAMLLQTLQNNNLLKDAVIEMEANTAIDVFKNLKKEDFHKKKGKSDCEESEKLSIFDRILQYMREKNEEVEVKELIKNLDCIDSSIRATMSHLVRAEKVERVGKGVYKLASNLQENAIVNHEKNKL